MFTSLEEAKQVISKGFFKVRELIFVPKGMRSERRIGGVKKHYDKRLKTKVWRVELWWFALEKADIKKVFEESWSGKDIAIKSIIQ